MPDWKKGKFESICRKRCRSLMVLKLDTFSIGVIKNNIIHNRSILIYQTSHPALLKRGHGCHANKNPENLNCEMSFWHVSETVRRGKVTEFKRIKSGSWIRNDCKRKVHIPERQQIKFSFPVTKNLRKGVFLSILKRVLWSQRDVARFVVEDHIGPSEEQPNFSTRIVRRTRRRTRWSRKSSSTGRVCRHRVTVFRLFVKSEKCRTGNWLFSENAQFAFTCGRYAYILKRRREIFQLT